MPHCPGDDGMPSPITPDQTAQTITSRPEFLSPNAVSVTVTVPVITDIVITECSLADCFEDRMDVEDHSPDHSSERVSLSRP
jgi:hypothetical protein